MKLCGLTLLGVVVALPVHLRDKLEAIAKYESSKYNCSVSIAVRSKDDLVEAADGIVDFRTSAKAKVTDKYAWGSCTKIHTAASILNLVAKGSLALDDTIYSRVDDVLSKMRKGNPGQNFTTVEDLWGDHIKTVTIRDLLSMGDGVPDFDTANPALRPGEPSIDHLREKLYQHPDHLDTPAELMNFPWVAGHWHKCKAHWIPPIGKFCYSSTNFMLLGLVLAHHENISDWKDLDQSKLLPDYLKNGQVIFAKDGTPVSYGAARGYDRTSYNLPYGKFNDHDNGDVKGVFAGWTASNIVASAAGMANLTWEIYNTNTFASKEYIQQMIPAKPSFFHPVIPMYGLGTFNLDMQIGQRGKYGVGYGHPGATYGYQSITGYFPGLDVVISIGTNIETEKQDQPSDALCFTYNAVASVMLNQHIDCTYRTAGYYGGICICDPIQESSAIFV